jgi:hypothetical protein
MRQLCIVLISIMFLVPALASAQKCSWVKQDICNGNNRIDDLAVDANGNCYITGAANEQPYIGIFSPSGTLIKKLIVSGNIIDGAVAAPSADNGFYYAVRFTGSLKVASLAISSGQDTATCIAKFNSSGKVSWYKTFARSFTPTDILYAGQLFVSGARYSQNEFFLVSFNDRGEQLWMKQQKGSTARKVVADAAARQVYVLGDAYMGTAFESVQMDGYQVNFVCAYSFSGKFNWATKTSDYYGASVGMGLNEGKVYVAGHSGRYPSNAWVKAIDTADGKIVENTPYFSSDKVFGSSSEGLSSDARGHLFYAYTEEITGNGYWSVQPKKFGAVKMETDPNGNLYLLATAPSDVTIGGTNIKVANGATFFTLISPGK